MKQTLLIICFISMAISCNSIERGAADNETLSRKLFDTMRDNDFDKSVYLLPDKGTFRKIEEHNGKTHEDVNIAYEAFLAEAEKKFNESRSMLQQWEGCKYVNTSTLSTKYGNLPAETVTTKFNGAGEPYKITFTAVKFNNRWYSMGDVSWVAKWL